LARYIASKPTPQANQFLENRRESVPSQNHFLLFYGETPPPQLDRILAKILQVWQAKSGKSESTSPIRPGMFPTVSIKNKPVIFHHPVF
jgi:hypothetical protein